jgi:hypothetical protein
VSPLLQEKGGRLYLPLPGAVKPGDAASFLLVLPGATAASVKAGDKSVALLGKDGVFIGDAKATAEMTLFVKYPDQKQYQGVARYKVE